MAEKVTSLAVENVVEQLEQVPALVKETQKLKSLRRVKTRFSNISTILKEFDGQEYEPEVADWLKKVRDAAYETQGVIGSIVVETNYQNQKSKLGRLLSKEKETKHHDEEIKNIEKQIKSIYSFKDNTRSNKKSQHSQRSISFKTDEVVGFRDAQETLVNMLIDDAKTQLEVLLIHGKAGSGKTTLAKMVYNDGRIKERYGNPKWMSFPQELPLEELLCRTLKITSSPSNQYGGDSEEAGFWESLKGKRYFVVIDSVYKDHELNELMSLFPKESNGSRILLASRVPQAELNVQGISFSYEVDPLNANQSWELLSRRLLLKSETRSNLENLGKQLAEKCKGSPRAIVAMAAILNSAEKTEEMWSKLLEGYAQIADHSNYYDLHKDLQFCLLYFGLFPEHVRISAKQIIQMWMAEGLLKKKGSKEAEEIGEEYLKKLIDQSFIQVDTRRADRCVKTCRASSHISHLLISEGADEKFFEVHMNINPKPITDIRRKAIHSESVTDVLKSFGISPAQSLDSLHCFGKNSNPTPIHAEGFWETLLNNFRQLKVLNLGFLELDKVPKESGKLANLKYLRLRALNAKHLPSFIVNLQQLETLDMRDSCRPINLPHGIWEMQFLRHLYLGASTYLPKTSGSGKALSNLQTLSGVYSDKTLKWLMVRAKFPNVRKLRICSSDSNLTCNFLNSLDHLYHLQSLRVEKSTKLPKDLNAFPISLTKLTLLETELQPTCIKTLEKLPNLRILKLLKKAISTEEIACSNGGFLQLEVLYLENLIVKKWTIEGAMKSVKSFFTKDCNDDILETAPDYLKQVRIEIRKNRTEGQGFSEAATILREG